MKNNEQSDILKWIHGWENTASLLRKEREDRLNNIDLEQIIEDLEEAFLSAILHLDDSKFSGLVELQKYLKRMRT